MSRGKGAKTPYLVYVRTSVSEVIEVQANNIEEAIEIAEGRADRPNESNEFEAEGDAAAWSVMDSGGNQLWCANDDDGTPP